ncbi:MAG: hypothetical protein JKY61_04940 [Planctomycetes bacterium]|nr:hypothetical protein [Planctomycetota bacterium]
MEGTGTFTIGRSFSEACAATIGSLGLVLGAMLTCYLIYLVSAVTVIGYIIFMPVLGWGVIRFGLNLIDGRARFEDLFSGFTNYGSRLWRMIFLGLVMVLIGLIATIPFYFGLYTGNWIVMGIGLLFSMVVGGFMVARLYFAVIFMVDQDMGVLESIQASLDATRNIWLLTLGLAIVAGIVGMLGGLALIVGLLVSIPISYLMWVSAYRQIVGRSAE